MRRVCPGAERGAPGLRLCRALSGISASGTNFAPPRAMWLQALFTSTDLERILCEITPIQIALDEPGSGRYLSLDRPSQVETTADHGIRVVTAARLQWDLLGVGIPVVLRSVTLALTPSIGRRDGKDMLTFSARIEEADFSALPGVVESPLLERVNAALAEERAHLVWHFMDTLDFHFKLPDNIEPPRQLHLYARWGALRMTAQGVAVAASFSLNAEHLRAS